MTVKDVLKHNTTNKKLDFYFINMEKVQPYMLSQLGDYPVKFLEDESDENRKSFKILVSKENHAHSREVRKVSNCTQCLRWGWCTFLTDELRDEIERLQSKEGKMSWD